MSGVNWQEPLRDLLEPLHPTDPLPRFVRAEGASYYTVDGREYIDLNEMRVVLGQNNVPFKEAISRAYGDITAAKNVGAPAKTELLSYLDEATDGAFEAVHLTASGSEAVESAVRIVQRLTGRSEILSFWNSIHGRTYLSSSMSGRPQRKAGCAPLAAGVIYLPYPDCIHCPMHGQGACGFACLSMAERIYEMASAQEAAAVIVEPYQGAGVVVPPEGYLTRLQDWAHSKGMLLIADEVQSGMGRTGSMFLYQQEGLQPDLLLIGKALGNGMHIAAVLSRTSLPKEALAPYAGGSGDDPVACAAACEVLRQLRGGLLEHVREAGSVLAAGLMDVEQNERIRKCRCRGLAASIVFGDAADGARVHDALLSRGYLTGYQEDTLFLKPPYVITAEQISSFLAALQEELSF